MSAGVHVSVISYDLNVFLKDFNWVMVSVGSNY